MALPDFPEHEVLRRLRRLAALPHWAWLPEAAVGTLALAALNILFWSGDPGFQSSALNPFLTVVILVALRYGASAGFGTGLMAAGTWLSVVGSLARIPIGPELLDSGQAWTPAVFVLAGLVVGALVQPIHARVAYYRGLAEERDREMELSKGALGRLQARLEQSGSPAASPTGLIEQIRAMKSLDEERMWRAFLDLLGAHFGVEAAAYRLRDRRLELAAFEGGAWAGRPAERLETETGLPALALERGRLVTALELRDPRSERFLLCGPLNGPQGEKLGVVGIQRIAFQQMNARFLQRLSALLDWTGSCLVHARRQASRAEGDGATPVLHRSFLNLHLDTMEDGVRDGCEVLLFCIGHYETMLPARKALVRQSTGRILHRAIRSGDFVCETGQPDTFAVVLEAGLPGSNGHREALLDRVRREQARCSAAREEIPEHLLFSAVRVWSGNGSLEERIAEAEWQLVSPEEGKDHGERKTGGINRPVR